MKAPYVPAVKCPGGRWRVLRDHFLANPAAVLRLAREVGPIEIIDLRSEVRAIISVPGKRAKKK